jgi:hypothetical protein
VQQCTTGVLQRLSMHPTFFYGGESANHTDRLSLVRTEGTRAGHPGFRRVCVRTSSPAAWCSHLVGFTPKRRLNGTAVETTKAEEFRERKRLGVRAHV